jgi:hypothetical protein
MDDLEYWEDYTAAFFRSNGIDYRSEDSNVLSWLQAEDRAPFVKMVEALLPRLGKKAVLSDVDFVLLAHWMPDLHLGTSVTNFAMHQLGLTKAFGFAISDRGLSAPFFALDCIEKYLRGERRKALLIVMDQKHLLYKSEVKDTLKPHNSACLMLLERRNGPGLCYLGYRRQLPVPQGSLTEGCFTIIDFLSLRRNLTTIITSDRLLMNLDMPNQIVKADPQLVCAAPFVALSESIKGNNDYLLLIRDDDCLTGIGFRSEGPEKCD